jgi:(p)ppGpp synthase/HD superfamily hydrolase
MNLKTKALLFAEVAHAGQKRKGTGEPYVNHCCRVAAHVERLGFEDHVVAAAYLHDVIEDTPARAELIAEVFGEKVAELVMELTKPEHEGNRAERHAKELKRLKGISGDAAWIKFADIMDNGRDAATNLPEDFAELYLSEKRDQLVALFGEGMRHGKAYQSLYLSAA